MEKGNERFDCDNHSRPGRKPRTWEEIVAHSLDFRENTSAPLRLLIFMYFFKCVMVSECFRGLKYEPYSLNNLKYTTKTTKKNKNKNVQTGKRRRVD